MSKPKQSPVPPDAFVDLLPVEALYIAPGEYEMVSSSGQRLFYVEGSALAEWLRDRINAAPVPRSRSKKQKIEDDLRQSDLTARLAGRDDVEYGHHERERCARAICLFCAEPEHYGPPKEIEGSRRLWHADLRNDCNGVVQCQAAAIREGR